MKDVKVVIERNNPRRNDTTEVVQLDDAIELELGERILLDPLDEWGADEIIEEIYDITDARAKPGHSSDLRETTMITLEVR